MIMNNIAVFNGSFPLYWSSIVIFFGLLAALFLSLALCKSNGTNESAILLFLPLAILISVPVCRLIHWYCNSEQYAGVLKALTDYSSGSFCISGALLGCWLSAVIVSRLGFGSSTAKVLDAFAPGAALAAAFIRLSALFNTTCRGKMIITIPMLQTLPIASAVTNGSGGVEYRFASFFMEFLILILVTGISVSFFYKNKDIKLKRGGKDGNVMRITLVMFCAVEFLFDSTRYDSSFMPINGFVSFAQIVSAVCILAVLIYYSVNSIRSRGFRFYHFAMWLAYLLSLAGAGGLEYLVQRYGNLYYLWYPAMALSLFLMVLVIFSLYKSCKRRKKKAA